MTNKLNVIVPTTFPEGTSTSNSGVGMNQLPPGHTKISGNGTIASIGAVVNGGFPGQFPKNTKIENNWLKDPQFKTPK